ncbi:RNA methyltransferase [bacterium]|nr:RNA methyltransferase [bacterium]
MTERRPRWVVGVHACMECLRTHPEAIKEMCFLDAQAIKSPLWQPFLQKLRVKPTQKSVSFFKELSEFGHQGVALATTFRPEAQKNSDTSAILFLDGVEDPHNLGAIVRTSWLMGAEQIYISDKNSVKMTPTACKVASGGAEHIPVDEIHFLSEMKRLKDKGYWIYGFSEKAEKTLYEVELPAKTVLVFGSEEKGIRSPIINECDELLSIPQVQVQASYNVSVSAAIALSEYRRQQISRIAKHS